MLLAAFFLYLYGFFVDIWAYEFYACQKIFMFIINLYLTIVNPMVYNAFIG